MNDSTQRILDLLEALTASILDESKTPEQADLEFCERVSKEQLEQCLTDESLDAEDVMACKEMLKMFFNYEVTVN